MTERSEGTRPHGGDDSIARRWPSAPRPWIDLSTGINPFPYPVAGTSRVLLGRLPQQKDEIRARESLAAFLGLTGIETVRLTPGSQILINQLPFLFEPARVAIYWPNYNEHEPAWSRAGHEVVRCHGLEDVEDCPIVAVTNPNNPDGTRFDASRLLQIAEQRARQGGWLVVDEAFADLIPGLSLCHAAGSLPVIVLRSFGKFFGLAGLRLGALIAEPTLCTRMEDRLGPWSVSSLGLELAARAYADRSWIESTRGRLAEEARILGELLFESGLQRVGGTDLFQLTAHPSAPAIYHALGRRGILVRSFSYRSTWLRFGLPGKPEHRKRLEEALKEVMDEHR